MSNEVVMDSFDQLGVMEILRQPFKIFSRNWKLMAFITVLSLLPSYLLFLGNHFAIKPFILDLVFKKYYLRDKRPWSSEYHMLVSKIRKDILILMGIELIFTVTFWVIFLLAMVSTVYASAVTYSGRKLTLKDLFYWIVKTWRRPAITSFYVSFVSVGCILLILAIIGLFAVVSTTSIFLFLLALVPALLVLGINLYLSSVWSVGLLVSVLEDVSYGPEALGKAEELIKGRKLQGYILTLILALVSTTILGFLGYELVHVRTWLAVIALGLTWTTIICPRSIYSSMMYTVFYYECKKSNGEKVEIQLGLGYSMAPTIPHVSDEALP